MGCKHSSTIKVQPVQVAPLKNDNTTAKVGKEGSTQTPTLGRKNLSRESTVDEYELDDEGNKVRRKKSKKTDSRRSNSRLGSALSLQDSRSLDGDRGFSATSKASADSGLGGDDYGKIITEYSNEDAVRRVEQTFVERDDLDLNVVGTQLSTRLSAKDRSRQEESSILQALREEGLIAKQTAQSSGGMSFEIVEKDASNKAGLPSLPPRQLEKLEKRRKKKKVLTEDEIKEKLERAERRRKRREEEKLSKIKEMERTDALAALENFEQYKKVKETNLNQKLDAVSDKRQQQLLQIREKMKERERRAEEVRKRKQKALMDGLSNNGIIDNVQEYPTGIDNTSLDDRSNS